MRRFVLSFLLLGCLWVLFFPELSCLLPYRVTSEIKKHLTVQSVKEHGDEGKLTAQMRALQADTFQWKRWERSSCLCRCQIQRLISRLWSLDYLQTNSCTVKWSQEQALNYMRQTTGKRNGSLHPVHWPSLSSQGLPKVQSATVRFRMANSNLMCGL